MNIMYAREILMFILIVLVAFVIRRVADHASAFTISSMNIMYAREILILIVIVPFVISNEGEI